MEATDITIFFILSIFPPIFIFKTPGLSHMWQEEPVGMTGSCLKTKVEIGICGGINCIRERQS